MALIDGIYKSNRWFNKTAKKRYLDRKFAQFTNPSYFIGDGVQIDINIANTFNDYFVNIGKQQATLHCLIVLSNLFLETGALIVYF